MTGPTTDPIAGDEELTPAELEAGRLLFAQECRFIAGAVGLDHMPSGGLPEVAFAGRSNVGKSSLVNALTNRKTLARTSNTPGRTQQINLFDLGGRLVLADLPGYGYAKVSKAQSAAWSRFITDYLRGRPELKRCLVLVDSRHGLKPTDIQVMDLLDESAVNYQVVLTKADKQTGKGLAAVKGSVAEAIAKRVAAHPDIAVTSADKGTGIPELRAVLARLAQPA
ncbi:MAG: ribosome biogenesis GTP-binding protein YihA/YsxC [Alphaproteobacteria bacterium]|nr:ribosome biogenesis GTP-binding protein YihA/YsxC [Alphaproteobacteria bacterium]